MAVTFSPFSNLCKYLKPCGRQTDCTRAGTAFPTQRSQSNGFSLLFGACVQLLFSGNWPGGLLADLVRFTHRPQSQQGGLEFL